MPPPAPEPLLPAFPPLPLLEVPDPLLPPLELLPPEGSAGVLWSGGMVEPLVAPDRVPVASGLSPDAAKVATEAADNNPANTSEVILMFIMVRLQR
ncbi:hypothetical protein AEQ67_14215 [Pseudomonas sp. RIT-PI-q]|nr:hypothetical protein AEQ67_14215 [Pseudomonas sp. RIT-PI-q]